EATEGEIEAVRHFLAREGTFLVLGPAPPKPTRCAIPPPVRKPGLPCRCPRPDTRCSPCHCRRTWFLVALAWARAEAVSAFETVLDWQDLMDYAVQRDSSVLFLPAQAPWGFALSYVLSREMQVR